MRSQFSLRPVFAFLSALALVLPGAAFADHGGGGHGHGGFRNGAAFHGYVHGGGHYAYNARPYYGAHYYARPYYGRSYHYAYGPRWYGALALGTFVATLPLYYDTLWWGGIPYYYNENTYYRWNPGVSEYEVVAPPNDEASGGSSEAATPADLFVYPKDGQSEELQKKDRYECHRWAADQTGFDPTQTSRQTSRVQDSSKTTEYVRAETACLTGRGYSVK